jgi:3-hydroxyacyl-[acyl-carrier-protein] dehydratase
MSENGHLETADIIDILKLLPHRYPFVLVDRIVDMQGDDSATGIKAVTANEAFLIGYLVGKPMMPGMLLIEGMAQTAGVVCLRHIRIEAFKPSSVVYFMGIDRARFRRPVIPGDIVLYHVRKMRQRGTIWRYGAQARVNGRLVAEAEMSAVFVER